MVEFNKIFVTDKNNQTKIFYIIRESYGTLRFFKETVTQHINDKNITSALPEQLEFQWQDDKSDLVLLCGEEDYYCFNLLTAKTVTRNIYVTEKRIDETKQAADEKSNLAADTKIEEICEEAVPVATDNGLNAGTAAAAAGKVVIEAKQSESNCTSVVDVELEELAIASDVDETDTAVTDASTQVEDENRSNLSVSSSGIDCGDWQIINGKEQKEAGQAKDAEQLSSASTVSAVESDDNQNEPEQELYHPLDHINESVRQMLEMGFSNQNGWLTLLLDSVDGNIVNALEKMNFFNEN